MFQFIIDPFSFFLGFVSALILGFIALRARPTIDELRASWKERQENAQARRANSMEEAHRRAILRRAQGMHLAAQLFSLDEILQEPLLIAPPARVEPGTPPQFEDIVTQTLPYLPTWPEIAAAFQPQTLTLPQAIAGDMNIVIIGQPGSGKTVALAHLASLAANRSEELGANQELIPFLVHVAELNLPIKDSKNLLNPLIDAAAELGSISDNNRLSNFIQFTFENEKALLLVDGYDEITPAEQKTISDYFKQILQQYPKTRIVTTGTPEFLDGVVSLGFMPLSVSVWQPRQVQAFIERWGELWTQTIGREAMVQNSITQVDPLLLNIWLSSDNLNLSPLEVTLKAWGAYAGDSLGPHVLELIATHIRRLAPANTPLAALETLAMQVVVSQEPVFDPRKARAWVKSFEVVDEVSAQGDESTGTSSEMTDETKEETQPKKGKKSDKKKVEKVSTPSGGLLGKMAASGLLISHPHNRMRFAHPVLVGYLAGHALTYYNVEETVLDQPDWSGKYLALRYFSAHGDASKLVQKLLEFSRLPMHRPLFAAARWLRDAPRNAAWRGKLFSTLAAILQTEGIPLSLRGQAMAAFVYSNDPSAATLFRQFATTTSFELVHLAILGAGAMRDPKAVRTLGQALMAPSLSVRRAACMALVAIGTDESLEIVARTLLSGDEEIRRAAGEALANDPVEGHAMLKDGISINDILLRRAVIYGLGRIHEPWALEMLKKAQIEDEQWVVRNAATEVLDAKTNIRSFAPMKLKAPHETPWLLEFAAKKGMGISPGVPATDVLLLALKENDPDTRLASLPYLKFTPNEGVIAQIYNAMYQDDPEFREAAYHTLWEIGTSGVKLPHPSQYGLS